MRVLARTLLAAGIAVLFAHAAVAQEAVIRKNIAERMPDFPKIDEVTKTPIPGVYELRIGTELLYSDERGEHLIQGALIETRTGTNLTEARIEKLTAIDFAALRGGTAPLTIHSRQTAVLSLAHQMLRDFSGESPPRIEYRKV